MGYWHVMEKIGTGFYSTVYRVEDHKGNSFAMKVFKYSKNIEKDFKREIDAYHHCPNHLNLRQVFDYKEGEWIIFEYCNNRLLNVVEEHAKMKTQIPIPMICKKKRKEKKRKEKKKEGKKIENNNLK